MRVMRHIPQGIQWVLKAGINYNINGAKWSSINTHRVVGVV